MTPLALLFEPGFFSSEPVRTALIVGGSGAVVSSVVGVFTLIRGRTFAGHALADVSSAGGSASFLFGVNPLLGFLGMAAVAGAAMELAPARLARERDLVTGVMLGAGLGLTALFLYLDVTIRSTTGATIAVMFGTMFAIPPSLIPLSIAVGAVALLVTGLLYRPLLLSSLSPELAQVQGIPARALDLVHLLVLALAVSLAAITQGAILSTALLIGPPAIALRLTGRPLRTFAVSAITGLAATWMAILLAYDSYDWTGARGWPVSFLVTALIFLSTIAAGRMGADRGPERPAAHAPHPVLRSEAE